MKTFYKMFILLIIFALSAATVSGQGTTTAGMNGKVTDGKGESLPGASVLAVEASTGSQYGTITDSKGFYRLPNMSPGGP